MLGLALGMTCSLLIMLWVQDEINVNQFHQNAPQIYSVYERQTTDGKTSGGYYTPGVLADEMKKVLPEVQYASGFAWEDQTTWQFGDKINKLKGNHGGVDFFKMFSFKLLQGTSETALKGPNSVAISRKMAGIFFGSPQAAIGKILRYENRKDMMVTAVFEDMSDNSSIKFDYLNTWELFLEDNRWAKEWGNNGPSTYVMLKPSSDAKKFEAKIKNFLDKYNKEQNKAFFINLYIQPFSERYLYSNFKNGYIDGGRIQYVQLFSIVAIFILLIACINFMNLATARSSKRAKEVGIRKVVGAVRSLLVGQFIGEAVLITFFSAIVAIVLVVLILPSFNTLTSKTLEIPLDQPVFGLLLSGLLLLTGFLSGSYPALFLSSLNPINVLKGSLKFSSRTTWFRKGLVVFQFALSTMLIVGMIVIYRQLDLIQYTNLGYDRDNMIYIPLEGDLTLKYNVFKETSLKMNGIKEITRITQTFENIGNGTGGVQWEGKDPNTQPEFTHAAVGYDFVETMGLELLQGRDFSKDLATDSTSYIINETALKIIAYKDPLNQPLTFWENKGKIIGVLKDFHFQSFHEPIKPIIIRLTEQNGWGRIVVRVEAGKTKQALAGLEKICKALNPKFPFSYYFSDEEYAKLYKSEQVVGRLSNYFAFLAIFISCLGLFGLAMFTAEQRTKEISIRKVLGASVPKIIRLLSKDFLQLVLIANVIAFPLAWWAMNSFLQNFAYRTSISWWIFVLAGIIAIIIALLTVSYQSVKAALVNPVKSLKTE